MRRPNKRLECAHVHHHDIITRRRRRRREIQEKCSSQCVITRPGNTVSKLVFYYPSRWWFYNATQRRTRQGRTKNSHKYSYRFRYWYFLFFFFFFFWKRFQKKNYCFFHTFSRSFTKARKVRLFVLYKNWYFFSVRNGFDDEFCF